jgi:hypothetical protein
VQKVLAMTPAEEEAALLRARIDDNLVGRSRYKKSGPTEALRKKFDGLKSVDELVKELLRLARERPAMIASDQC